jgi:hypothetical protein
MEVEAKRVALQLCEMYPDWEKRYSKGFERLGEKIQQRLRASRCCLGPFVTIQIDFGSVQRAGVKSA